MISGTGLDYAFGMGTMDGYGQRYDMSYECIWSMQTLEFNNDDTVFFAWYFLWDCL